MQPPKVVTAELIRQWFPPRAKKTHKGEAGRVLIVAGSRGMVGAAVLCAMGAVRSGAGLVRLAIVQSQQNNAVKRAPLEITTLALSEDSSGRLSLKAHAQIKRAMRLFQPSVIALGPGLGTNTAVRKLVGFLLKKAGVPVVLDADGINVLSKQTPTQNTAVPVILTPHAGEMGRFLKWPARRVVSNRIGSLIEVTRRMGCVCLLKGADTLISDGRAFWKNPTGNPAMASGGMGDVLTGIIASLWAQQPLQNNMTGLRAACAGAYIHGLAADLALKKFPERTMTASNVAEFLPEAFFKIFGGRNE